MIIKLKIRDLVPKTYWTPPKNEGMSNMTPAFIDNPMVKVNAANFGLLATLKKYIVKAKNIPMISSLNINW